MERLFNNQDLYPTPKEVIAEMFNYGSSPAGKIILEPSAGFGNIVDYCKTNGAKEVIACEKDHKLRAIVGQKCKLIGDDFLQVTSEMVSHINMIVMNPPFSADEDHILHAFDIAPSGCEILALCNYNSINRPSNRKKRMFKETVESFGMYEYFGNCFEEAERQTGVEIGFIRLLKPIEEKDDFAGYFDMDDADSIDKTDEGLTTYNYVQDIVSRYVDALKKFAKVVEVEADMNDTISVFNSRIVFQPTSSDHDSRFTTIDFEAFKKKLQASAWKMIFGKFKMEKYVTKGVREDLNKFIETQQNVPFTVKNVYKMIYMVIGTQGDRMNQVLVEAFERICSFSNNNSTAGETWRTNSNYKINRKFIHPWITDYDTRWPTDTVRIDYRAGEQIDDIVKALCFLTGTEYQSDYDSTLCGFFTNNKISWGEWAEWGFFRVKGFKKRTMHFEFLDQNLCDEFNLRVAKAKGWRLPSDTKAQPRAKPTDVTIF